ncbi:hypothetical protein ACJX0J_038386 [Zea mays]
MEEKAHSTSKLWPTLLREVFFGGEELYKRLIKPLARAEKRSGFALPNYRYNYYLLLLTLSHEHLRTIFFLLGGGGQEAVAHRVPSDEQKASGFCEKMLQDVEQEAHERMHHTR